MGTGPKAPTSSRRPAVAAGTDVALGDVLDGKYRVDRVLGAGGMGVVVAAQHQLLDQNVAIKLLLEGALQSPESIARFEQEARAAVRIKSQHVARVIDVGHLDTGAPYIVMEHLDGEDLAVRLQERGALAIDEAVELVLQTCDALAEAHALGIVHRDLKPGNLFCTRGADRLPSIKVLDFGISKILWDSGAVQRDRAITRTQTLVGTPHYMSPEQMQSSKHVDARTDLWSLGVILFELLAGRPPFDGDELPSLILKVATAGVPSLRALRPEVPARLEGVVLKCLEKDPARRYANVGELSVALGPFAPARARSLVERIVRIVDANGQAATAVATAPPPPREPTIAPWDAAAGGSTRSRRPVRAWTAAAALALLFVVGGAAVSRRSSSTPASGPPVGPTEPSSAPAAVVSASAAPALPSVADSSVPPPAASVLPVSKPRRAAPPRTPAAASAPTPRVSYDHM